MSTRPSSASVSRTSEARTAPTSLLSRAHSCAAFRARACARERVRARVSSTPSREHARSRARSARARAYLHEQLVVQVGVRRPGRLARDRGLKRGRVEGRKPAAEQLGRGAPQRGCVRFGGLDRAHEQVALARMETSFKLTARDEPTRQLRPDAAAHA